MRKRGKIVAGTRLAHISEHKIGRIELSPRWRGVRQYSRFHYGLAHLQNFGISDELFLLLNGNAREVHSASLSW